MTPLSPHAQEALITLTVEPLWKRKGSYVRASEIDQSDAETFAAMLVRLLMLRRLVSIRSRRNPRRIEAKLTDDGRAMAAYLLAQAAELYSDVEAEKVDA